MLTAMVEAVAGLAWDDVPVPALLAAGVLSAGIALCAYCGRRRSRGTDNGRTDPHAPLLRDHGGDGLDHTVVNVGATSETDGSTTTSSSSVTGSSEVSDSGEGSTAEDAEREPLVSSAMREVLIRAYACFNGSSPVRAYPAGFSWDLVAQKAKSYQLDQSYSVDGPMLHTMAIMLRLSDTCSFDDVVKWCVPGAFVQWRNDGRCFISGPRDCVDPERLWPQPVSQTRGAVAAGAGGATAAGAGDTRPIERLLFSPEAFPASGGVELPADERVSFVDREGRETSEMSDGSANLWGSLQPVYDGSDKMYEIFERCFMAYRLIFPSQDKDIVRDTLTQAIDGIYHILKTQLEPALQKHGDIHPITHHHDNSYPALTVILKLVLWEYSLKAIYQLRNSPINKAMQTPAEGQRFNSLEADQAYFEAQLSSLTDARAGAGEDAAVCPP